MSGDVGMQVRSGSERGWPRDEDRGDLAAIVLGFIGYRVASPNSGWGGRAARRA